MSNDLCSTTEDSKKSIEKSTFGGLNHVEALGGSVLGLVVSEVRLDARVSGMILIDSPAAALIWDMIFCDSELDIPVMVFFKLFPCFLHVPEKT